MIIELAKECGYYDDFFSNLKYRLEKSDLSDNKWCIKISHKSGRDFYKYRPIEMLTDDEIDNLKNEVLEDLSYDYNDDEFMNLFESTFNNDEAKDELEKAGYNCPDDEYDFIECVREYCEETIFDELFDKLVNENLS